MPACIKRTQIKSFATLHEISAMPLRPSWHIGCGWGGGGVAPKVVADEKIVMDSRGCGGL
jgi:hypothetical protein